MNNKKILVFIHGWGISSEIWRPLNYFLKNDFILYNLDLPGFGQTPIEKPMALKDYSDFVYKFLKKNKIEQPIIIGHSFGGAIAVKFSLLHLNEISKLILVGASAIRRKPNRKIILFKKLANFLKPLLSEKSKKLALKLLKLDKTDYSQIENPKLRETFKKIISEDLTTDLPLIKLPTLVIWGENDTETPLAEGKLIAKKIPGAKLEIIKDAGHFAFLEKPEKFIGLIKDFAK